MPDCSAGPARGLPARLSLQSVFVASLLVAHLEVIEASDGLCGETPINWTLIQEDLITYSTLGEPKQRSRRCYGLDKGIWSYCGISAVQILQLQPGLINGPADRDGPWSLPRHAWNPCAIGSVAMSIFSLIFLSEGERYGMFYQIGGSLDRLGMSFQEIRRSNWPIFGLFARLAEVVSAKDTPRTVPKCQLLSAGPLTPNLESLQAEVVQRVAQRRPIPELLSTQVVSVVGHASSNTECAFALAAAWAGLADDAGLKSDDEAASTFVDRAEASLRSFQSNYTHLDWLSTKWPVFRLLHRLQFSIPSASDTAPPADLVPHDLRTGKPLRFAFNGDFSRPDALYMDIAADIIQNDLVRNMGVFFGLDPALPTQKWDLNFVYTSNEYIDLIPAKSLLRLKAKSQKLVYAPNAYSIIGEKDVQCKTHNDYIGRWDLQPSFDRDVGGMPACFQLPLEETKLRKHAAQVESPDAGDVGGLRRQAFIYKPDGAWGGRGIDIRFGIDGLIGEASSIEDANACVFTPLEDIQCLGLHDAGAEASATEAACQSACCNESGGSCETWNWREGDGCWVGTSRKCSSRNPIYLGGWKGGLRFRASDSGVRAVVQNYVMDPVIYQLEGVHPPVRVKTDIRVYGSVISLDPLRLWVSKHGYFRTGYLERNYSTDTEDDFKIPLMHVTHHIPKIESGGYQCPNAESWGDEPPETEAGSGGSLHKWFKILKEQNGLDPKKVWENIRMVIGLFILEGRWQLSCQKNPDVHACGSVGFHFFADLVVDSAGRAWLMEIHPTYAVKPHGLGDPEAGWVEVLTRHSRQASLGTLAAFFMGKMNSPYRHWVERFIKSRLLTQSRWQVEVRLLRIVRQRERILEIGAGGEEATLAGLLARMLLEEHMSCRLSLAPVFPGLWRQMGRHLRPRYGGGPEADPFGMGLRPLYRLYEVARHLLRRRLDGGSVPGDLRPQRCRAMDFNKDTVWDQPWEKKSRRFKV